MRVTINDDGMLSIESFDVGSLPMLDGNPVERDVVFGFRGLNTHARTVDGSPGDIIARANRDTAHMTSLTVVGCERLSRSCTTN
jgi:hypothetical protein